MAWIILTPEAVATRLTGPELAACRQAALAPGQTDPLPEITGQVVQEIRGYIAANRANRLGEGETISDKLEGTALAIIRYRLANRLPVKTLLTQERVNENDAALRLLRDVAAARFVVDEPLAIDTTERVPTPTPQIHPRHRRFTRRDQEGI